MSVRVVEASPVRLGTPIVSERAHPHIPSAPHAAPRPAVRESAPPTAEPAWPDVDDPTIEITPEP